VARPSGPGCASNKSIPDNQSHELKLDALGTVLERKAHRQIPTLLKMQNLSGSLLLLTQPGPLGRATPPVAKFPDLPYAVPYHL
jgi:hypothetical protein